MNNEVISKVFSWMFVGLLVTFLTGYIISTNENMIVTVFETGSYAIFAITELILVIVLSARVRKMKPTTCRVMFILYSFVSGVTFSSIFIVYKLTSIIYIFLVAALVFGIFALIGYKTDMDLTKIGTYLIMALIAVIICSLINIFVGSETFDLVISLVVIIIFMGMTAYDVQKIKKSYELMPENNLAIYGALELYLDYINLFLNLISLFGKEK